jgi:hypothetical protein
MFVTYGMECGWGGSGVKLLGLVFGCGGAFRLQVAMAHGNSVYHPESTREFRPMATIPSSTTPCREGPPNQNAAASI